MSFGKTIDSAVIERGLRELNPNIHFDMASKMNGWHPNQSTKQGVLYEGRHICAMDRGLVPEFKQWSVVSRIVEVGWAEADKDDVSIQTQVIPKTDSGYVDATLHCMNNDLGWQYRPDGAVLKMTPVAKRKMQGRVVLVGWRHTFEKIIHRKIPGVTRKAIADKFVVDMLKYPIGAPHELLHAAFVEE
jgi:hypothetical protein